MDIKTLCISVITSVITIATSYTIAGQPLSFVDQAFPRGINHSFSFVNHPHWGAGIGLLDLDGDGDLDIILPGANGGGVKVYENDGTGQFTDRSLDTNIGAIDASGIAAADYDNDGDQDIFIGGWLVSSKLYRNDGGFSFTDVSAAAGVGVVSAAMGACWADYDLDGHMDLYLPTRTGTGNNYTPNMMFHNNGDGTFSEVALVLGVDAEQDPTLLASFFDFDRDGDDDLYLGTDKGTSLAWWNRLYRNDGGSFTEITFQANAEAYIDCMGIAVSDLNGDSYFDVYMTDGTRNALYLNDGMGAFVDVSDESGATSGAVGWGTVFADFDNDTYTDIYVCNVNDINRLYRGEDVANWPMDDDAGPAGVEVGGTSFCVAVGDVNNDGLLDMLVGHIGSPTKLFINQSPSAASNHMLELNPVGDTVNSMGVGTCINLFANGRWQAEEARAGVNYKVSESRGVHFGLGTATEASIVDVVWPGGTLRHLTGVPADRSWTIYQETRLGDPNNDGRIDWTERAAARAAMTGSGVKIEPGVEIFDLDGDFDIDEQDLAAMAPCVADLNGDTELDFLDVSTFLSNSVDMNGDMQFDFIDISMFLQSYTSGCP